MSPDPREQLRNVFSLLCQNPSLFSGQKVQQMIDDLQQKVESYFSDQLRLRQAQ